MDVKYFGLNEHIGHTVKNAVDQGRIVAIAVAIATSAQAHLPSSDVENPAAFYGEQVHPYVCEKISEVNESVTFGAKSALEYAQIFWKMRFFASYPAHMLVENAYQIDQLMISRASHNLDLTSIWAGGQLLVSAELSQFMNKYAREIMSVASRVAVILQPPKPEGGDSAQLVGGV